MSIDLSKSASIRNLREMLIQIEKNPSSFTDFDANHLKDQKRCASLDMPDRGITPMSLNRWKYYADEAFPNGWRDIDSKRKMAYAALTRLDQKQVKPSRGSRRDLESRLNEAQKQAQLCVNEIVRFSEQYKNLLEVCEIHARHDNTLENALKKHKQRYSNSGRLTVVSGDS